MTLGPSDTDAGAGPARKPKPVKPRAVPPKGVPARPVKPKKARPAKPVAPQAVEPAAPKPVAPKAAAPGPARAQAARRGAPKKPAAPAKSAKPAKPAAKKPAKPSGPRQIEVPGDPLIGKTVGRCRIQELVGVGRTARVYAAHYEALDDTVAVKVLRRDVAENPLLVERFHSEARAIAKVDNENVLKIYDVGTTDDGLHYMVVELLEGEEIFELLQREERIEPMDALRVIRQAANGLGAAHSHGLVHRDIKPQNLYLLEDGTVKVVDFGLAVGIDDKGERVGTPHYMAPEVCEHAKAETASDIYGLGITLFHLLTGQPPYAGKDIKGIMRGHIDGEPLRPERRKPDLPKDIGNIVRLLTKRDPLMRPTAAQVVEELDRYGGKELRKKETLKRRRTRSRARSAVARRERASKATPAVAAIVGALLVVGAIFAIVSRGGGGGDAPKSGGGHTAKAGDPDPIDRPNGALPGGSELMKKKRAEAEAARARIKEGQDALDRAEQWARDNWHGPADTEAVIAKYHYVREEWNGLPPGDEAKRRIALIKRKKMHPHPDRQWTSADDVAAARAAWKYARPQVEAKIAAHEYRAARALVPQPISDESGSFSRELDFWRAHTKHLVDFADALAREVTNLDLDERGIATPDGEGTVRRITGDGFVVRVGTKDKTYRWVDLGAEDIANLSMAAFSGKSADLAILQVAFTFAHKLKGPFWDAQIELGVTPGAGAYDLMNKAYKKRFEKWAAGR